MKRITQKEIEAVKEMAPALKTARIARILGIGHSTVNLIKRSGYTLEGYQQMRSGYYKEQPAPVRSEQGELPFYGVSTIKELCERIDAMSAKLEKILDRQQTLRDIIEEKRPAILSTSLFTRKRK